jgi:hypothetical protein
MFLLDEIKLHYITEGMSLLKDSPEFSVIYENLDLIEEAYKTDKVIIIDEAEKGRIDKAIDSFKDKAESAIKDAKSSDTKENFKATKTLGSLLFVGLTMLNGFLVIASGGAFIIIVLSVIFQLLTNYISLKVARSNNSAINSKKGVLVSIKKKVDSLKDKAKAKKNPKAYKRLDDMSKKLDQSITDLKNLNKG